MSKYDLPMGVDPPPGKYYCGIYNDSSVIFPIQPITNEEDSHKNQGSILYTLSARGGHLRRNPLKLSSYTKTAIQGLFFTPNGVKWRPPFFLKIGYVWRNGRHFTKKGNLIKWTTFIKDQGVYFLRLSMCILLANNTVP